MVIEVHDAALAGIAVMGLGPGTRSWPPHQTSHTVGAAVRPVHVLHAIKGPRRLEALCHLLGNRVARLKGSADLAGPTEQDEHGASKGNGSPRPYRTHKDIAHIVIRNSSSCNNAC